MKYSRWLACLALLATPVGAQDTVALPQVRFSGKMDLVTTFTGPMPTGVTVSSLNRTFINYPRWGDKVDHTVGELKGTKTVPYPPGIKQSPEGGKQEDALVSVQSVVVDAKDRLWILDTGSPLFAPTTFGGPKLVGVDLKTNKIFKKILFPVDVALPTSYLNDIRFDLRRGTDGMAFITDSADKGPNGIIVVDLDTGKSFRRLNDHPSTKAVPDFLPIVEGQPLMQREPGKPPKSLSMGSDGIAISPDGKRLYYCPLASRHLYSVNIDALVDQGLTEEQLAPNVVDEGDKGCASDGLETDAQGRIYITDYEHNRIARRLPNGTYETVVYDPRILWPDTMCIGVGGYLYFTDNQLNRQARYHNGQDLRQKPYSLLRVKIDSGPITLSAVPTAQK